MMNRICIVMHKEHKALKNTRVRDAFKNAFGSEPSSIRAEHKSIVVLTEEELKEGKVKKFADNLGSHGEIVGSDDSYSIKL